MKIFIIIAMLFLNLYGENIRFKSDDKDIKAITNKLNENLGNRLEKFNYKNNKYSFKVILKLDENGIVKYEIVEKSKNEEYNKMIEEFLNNENGKYYLKDSKFKKINIEFKSI